MKQHHKKIIRLAEQCERQQDYRERMESERRPYRDDIALMTFYSLVMYFYRRNRMDRLDRFMTIVINRLEQQGFDRVASDEVFNELVEKYTIKGWKPRQKFHSDKPQSDD